MHRLCRIAAVLISLFALTAGAARQTMASPQIRTESRILGKTPAQIAAMGIVPWTNLYCGAKQWTTASQADAAAIFGRSLRRVNDSRIAAARLSRADRRKIETIRRISTTYSASLLEIAARDGGSMWVPMRAGVPAAVEELIADLIPVIDRKRAPASPTQASKIRRLIAATEAGLAQADGTVKQPGNTGLAIHLQKARASFARVKKEYAALSWPGSLVVLDWYAARSGRFTPDTPER